MGERSKLEEILWGARGHGRARRNMSMGVGERSNLEEIYHSCHAWGCTAAGERERSEQEEILWVWAINCNIK